MGWNSRVRDRPVGGRHFSSRSSSGTSSASTSTSTPAGALPRIVPRTVTGLPEASPRRRRRTSSLRPLPSSRSTVPVIPDTGYGKPWNSADMPSAVISQHLRQDPAGGCFVLLTVVNVGFGPGAASRRNEYDTDAGPAGL
jgi:hypothetical protein